MFLLISEQPMDQLITIVLLLIVIVPQYSTHNEQKMGLYQPKWSYQLRDH
jgi:hypothetical protein